MGHNSWELQEMTMKMLKKLIREYMRGTIKGNTSRFGNNQYKT